MALKGIRVLELAGLAPVPFCGMILADYGASVVRIDKVPSAPDVDSLGNGKQSIALNIKSDEGVSILKKLASNADVLIEPFRPGVMEKLGLGPDALMKENRKLIYARLSGFGQTGLFAPRAGHDINYVAMSGLLSMIGGPEKVPSPPVNFAADFAGGGLLCALGIVMALFERSKSGMGQIIDAGMTSGVAYAGSWLYRSRSFLFSGPRGTNLLDGGSHFYCCYETKDGKFMAVGALEPQFYKKFIEGLGLDPSDISQTDDKSEAKAKIQGIFKKYPQQHWIEVYKDTDACVTPVLEINEAAEMNKHLFRRTDDDSWAPVAAPVLSRTPAETQAGQPKLEQGQHTVQILADAGYSKQEIEQFLKKNIVTCSKL